MQIIGEGYCGIQVIIIIGLEDVFQIFKNYHKTTLLSCFKEENE